MVGGCNARAIQAQIACVWEVSARKVGNVHPSASFADMEWTDFLISAATLGENFFASDYVVGGSLNHIGWRVLHTSMASRSWTGANTNLGITILLSPLYAASQIEPDESLREKLAAVLQSMNRSDASHVFEAIRLANPGGLGDAPEQDVRAEPTVTLLEAMKLAADRDMVARQYANGFADVFDFGVPAFCDALARFGCVEAAIIDSQLRWLAAYPDSLIARKNGLAVAHEVQMRAQEVLNLGGIETPEGRFAGVALDRHLRSDGNKLNPGTTADLITACLFVALRENKVAPSAPFRWPAPDWL